MTLPNKYIEELLNTQYELGKLSIKEGLSNTLLDKASEYFRIGQDNYANLLRNLAKEFQAEAELSRKQYDNFAHKKHNEIWSILMKLFLI